MDNSYLSHSIIKIEKVSIAYKMKQKQISFIKPYLRPLFFLSFFNLFLISCSNDDLPNAELPKETITLDGIITWEAITDAINAANKVIINGDAPNLQKPLLIPSNKKIEVNGLLKIQNGFIDAVIEDVAISDTSITVENAKTKYFAGQQIVISDDNQPTQGGGTGQTRRMGTAITITSVTENIISFAEPINETYTMAANAKVGHCKSVILVENAGNVSITGTGIVDQNKENQFDVEPLYINRVGEDVRYGCGVTVNGSYNVFVGKGLTSRNAVLHCVQFHESYDFDIDTLTADGAHDKGLLLHDVDNFRVTNVRALNSDWEDGVYLHNDATNGFIDEIYTENCSRHGFGIGKNSSNITVNNVIAKDCGRAGQFFLSSNITIKSFMAIGGGKDRYLQENRPMFVIMGLTNSEFIIEVSENTLAANGISVIGGSKNLKIKAKVKGLINSEASGNGIVFGRASGMYPKNITLLNSSITENKTGVIIEDGCENIKAIDSDITGNTTNVINNAGEQWNCS
ncbi:hypothetical protein ACFQ3R_13980 [Mesonia ostreae]|uniref:Right handed beta helix domain-containing protein n=1 Tax=Mesonia ostreae TaxID=861110 RepID=A0ABU2KG64_9FLAO|nr:hypothetical protein [Mesonia ostreae]MDT0293690.1 hypothetical protein [Mesonia ostreae]